MLSSTCPGTASNSAALGRARTAARLRPRPAQTDRRPSLRAQTARPLPRLHLSGPQTGGDVCSLRHRQLLFLSAPLLFSPVSFPLPSTSPLICWRRWHLPQSGLNVCAPVGGGCPGRNFDLGGGAHASRSYCVNANGQIYGLSSLCAR